MRVHLCVCVCVCVSVYVCVCVCVCVHVCMRLRLCVLLYLFFNICKSSSAICRNKNKVSYCQYIPVSEFWAGKSPCSPIPKLWFLGKPKRNIVKATCQTATQPHVNPSEIYFSFFACCVYVLTRKKLFKVVTKNDSS